jgi:hypothetical protein
LLDGSCTAWKENLGHSKSVDLEDDLARRVRLARIGCRGVSGQRQWVEAAPDLYGKLEAEVVPRTMAMIAKNFH